MISVNRPGVESDAAPATNSPGCERVVAWSARGVAALAVAGLLGGFPALRVLGSIRPDYIPMAPTTAACFLVSSVALFCLRRKNLRGFHLLAVTTSLLLLLLYCLLEFAELFVGHDLNFDAAFLPASGQLGRIPVGIMSPATALTFCAAGTGALLLFHAGRSARNAGRIRDWASGLGALTALIGATVLLAYGYGTPLMYGGSLVPMAATTALAFVLLGVAVLAAAGPAAFLARLVYGDSTSALLSRSFLPLTVTAVVVQSLISRHISASPMINEVLTLAFMVVIVGVITAWVVNRVARSTGSNIDEVSGNLRRALHELGESEEHHRSILRTAMDGIWLVDTGGHLLEVNEAYCRMSGYSETELLQMTISDLEAVEDAADTALHFAKVMTLGEDRFETRHRRKDGSVYYVEVSVQFRPAKGGRMLAFLHDISVRKLKEIAHQTEERLLQLVNMHDDLHQSLSGLIASLQSLSECEAVGIRLREGDDYPYFESRGFSAEFIRAETHLCIRETEGEPLREGEGGNPVLECMCGNILCRRFDPARPFFTPRGSFWSNNTSALLAESSEADRLSRTRNRCNGEGYQSMALIPLQAGDRVIGLLQFNDRRPDRFTAALIETFEEIASKLALTLVKQKAEEDLRESRKQYHDLVEEMPDLVTRVDAEGRLLFVNHAALEIFGLTPQECFGRKVFDFIHPADRETTLNAFRQWMAGGEKIFTHENRQLAVDGREHHLAWSIRPEYDHEGKVCGFASTGRDITARVKAEEERLKLEAQLQQAQKLESVGSLAGGVAHDFNNMLSVILGHTSLALMELGPEHPLHTHLQEIDRAAERSADLTRQLLAFARKQTIAPRVLDLNETLTGMLKMLKRLIGEEISLEWKPGRGLGAIIMDPSQLDQILANLCVNARDAIVGVGKITIETANGGIDEAYCSTHAEVLPGQYVRLVVSDNGCGMERTTMERIYEPFFTTKELGKGTGLGLSTVFGIVKQNHGFINVYSEPGLGTTFSIYLPGHGGASEQKGMAPEPVAASQGGETILLVEDEPAILKIAHLILTRQGYTVLQSDTPVKALELAREHPGEIDLIVTDVVMPEMNGKELFDLLRSRRQRLRCLFMSGYTADAIARHGVLEDGVDFIQKPFTLPGLAGKVREVLDR